MLTSVTANLKGWQRPRAIWVNYCHLHPFNIAVLLVHLAGHMVGRCNRNNFIMRLFHPFNIAVLLMHLARHVVGRCYKNNFIMCLLHPLNIAVLLVHLQYCRTPYSSHMIHGSVWVERTFTAFCHHGAIYTRIISRLYLYAR